MRPKPPGGTARLVNAAIPYALITLIDAAGSNQGPTPLPEALAARPPGMDLLLVRERPSGGIPPICRIVPHEVAMQPRQAPQQQAPAKKAKVTLKQVKLGLTISAHDLERKLKSAHGFLEKGNHVQFVMEQKERAPNLAKQFQLMREVQRYLQPLALQLGDAQHHGRKTMLTFGPKRSVVRGG